MALGVPVPRRAVRGTVFPALSTGMVSQTVYPSSSLLKLHAAWTWRVCTDLTRFVFAALMSVKEMAKGITYDDPIKTRCVSQYRGRLSESIVSSRLK